MKLDLHYASKYTVLKKGALMKILPSLNLPGRKKGIPILVSLERF